MRCLLPRTLRNSCDKALSWGNNEWNRPISSESARIFSFLSRKEDRSSRGNEPFCRQSHSLLPASRPINRVKSMWQPRHPMQVSACSLSHCAQFPGHTADGPCAKKHGLVRARTWMEPPTWPSLGTSGSTKGQWLTGTAPEQETTVFKSWIYQLASVWSLYLCEAQFPHLLKVMMITPTS